MNSIIQILEDNPIIAALHNPKEDIKKTIPSHLRVIFLLGGSILTLPSVVETLHKQNRRIFIHIDLVSGLSRDREAVEFVAKIIKPEGIISTHPALMRHASALNLLTIQRIFLIDSRSLEKGMNSLRGSEADMAELMPGVIPSAIKKLRRDMELPIIAGGMLENKSDVIKALKAGAMAVSTSRPELWNI